MREWSSKHVFHHSSFPEQTQCQRCGDQFSSSVVFVHHCCHLLQHVELISPPQLIFLFCKLSEIIFLCVWYEAVPTWVLNVYSMFLLSCSLFCHVCLVTAETFKCSWLLHRLLEEVIVPMQDVQSVYYCITQCQIGIFTVFLLFEPRSVWSHRRSDLSLIKNCTPTVPPAGLQQQHRPQSCLSSCMSACITALSTPIQADEVG